MEYNRVLEEEMGHKTPSLNVVAEGKTLSPNAVTRGKKERREMEETEERRAVGGGGGRWARSNFKHNEVVVLNNGFWINNKAVVLDNDF